MLAVQADITKLSPADLLVDPRAFVKRLLVPERGVANPRPALSATLDARSTLLAPWVSNMRK